MAQPFVVLLKIDLTFPDAGSLKSKRAELRSIKAALHQKLGCAIAEVDGRDTWQRATLAAALVGDSEHAVHALADGVTRFLDSRFPQGAVVERSVASWRDLDGYVQGLG